MREKKINIIMLEPGKKAYLKEIDNTLESLQKEVKGYIEAIYSFEEEVCLVCNEEGKMNGMELNRAIYGEHGLIVDIIAGPAFLCGCSGEDFSSLNEKQVQKYQEMFYYPEQFLLHTGEGGSLIAIEVRKEM